MHDSFVSLATRLIAKNGRQMHLVKFPDSINEWDPPRDPELASITGVQLNFKLSDIDGDLVKETDRMYLIDSSVKPSASMRIRDFAVGTELIPLGEWRVGIDAFGATRESDLDNDFSIVAVTELKPGETTILYKIHARSES